MSSLFHSIYRQISLQPAPLKTYAVAWIDPTTKLRTRIDHDGEGNPTWNDKFLFRVSPNFIACETSAVDINIYAVGYTKNVLLGTVRFLLSNCLGKTIDFRGTPAFTAVQIRRSSRGGERGKERDGVSLAFGAVLTIRYKPQRANLPVLFVPLRFAAQKDKAKMINSLMIMNLFREKIKCFGNTIAISVPGLESGHSLSYLNEAIHFCATFANRKRKMFEQREQGHNH